MTANHPLDTEAHDATPMPTPAPEAGAAHIRAVPDGPQWAEAVAGQALRAPAPVRSPRGARRPPELEAVALRRAELAARREAMLGGPGRGYRSAYSIVLTLVLAFFAGGLGLAVYILASH